MSVRFERGLTTWRDKPGKPASSKRSPRPQVSNTMSDEAQITDVRGPHQFDEAELEAYLQAHLPGFRPPIEVRQFEGGQSNPTFLISTADRRMVMRKKPPGELLPSAHQVDREHRVMKALAQTDVPVPEMLVSCEDRSVIGTEFFVMEMVPGRVIEDTLLPNLSPQDRGALYYDFVEVLARLHRVDYEAVGLGEGYGRPGNYFARQIGRWSKQYRASKTEDIPEMDSLMDWLPANIPDDDLTTIVHGDYSIRNCIVHPTEPRVAAVLDWELSTLGHPNGDLAYCCLMYYRDLGEDELVRSGIPTQRDLLGRYFETSGRPPVDDWTFYMAYTFFRLAAIVQGVVKRGLDGNASSEQFLAHKPGIRLNAAKAWAMAQSR